MIGRLTQIILSIGKKTVIVSEGNDIHICLKYTNTKMQKYKHTNTQIQFDPNYFEQKQENCDS